MSQQNGVLIVALPQRGGAVTNATYELLSAGRQLADAMKGPLCALLIGDKVAGSAQDLIDRGADKVFVAENATLASFNDQFYAREAAVVAEKEGLAAVLLPSTVSGKAMAARLAVVLKAGLASDVTSLSVSGGKLSASRPTYSGNVIAQVEFKTPRAVATVQAMAWPRAEKQAGRSGQTANTVFDPAAAAPKTTFVSFQPEESNEVDLASAERIVSGGRGLGNAEGFKIVRDLAHAINAAVGASRAVVDSGWIAYRHQVGLTGRAVRPKLYVACGISGQIQHLAGMSSSGTIVAINTDPECPMMHLASISVVGDVNELLPLITAEVKKHKGAPVAA